MPIFIVTFAGLALIFPGIVRLLRSLITGAVRIGGHYLDISITALRWIVLGYVLVLVALVVAGAFAISGGNNIAFAIISFLIALMLLPLEGISNGAVRIANNYLPEDASLNPVKLITVSILVPIYAGITALLFPGAFFSWYGIFLLALLMAGLALRLAFPSNGFLSRAVLGTLSAVTFVLWIVVVVAPKDVEAVEVWKDVREAIKGRENVVAKLKQRPVQKVNATKGAAVWRIKTDKYGDPVKFSSGIVKAEAMMEDGKQKVLSFGKLFKTLDIKVDSVDAGEVLVQVFTQAQDDSWVQTEDASNQWIAVSRTDLATDPVIEKSETDQQATDGKTSKNSVTKLGGGSTKKLQMSLTKCFPTGIHLRKGQQVRILASGPVNASGEATKNDAAYKWVGPDGWQTDPPFNSGRKGPLSGGQSFMALAGRVSKSTPSVSDGQWTLIGSERVITVEQDGELFLVVNDKIEDQNGNIYADWFTNNQGGLSIEVQVI